MAGYGVNMGIANAQTLTSSQVSNAALEQELDVAKATLINLEMQEGLVPQGDDQLGGSAAPAVAQTQPTQTQATTGLSVSQISAFENTLATLVGTLSQLNATLNANPNMDASQIAAIETTLNGMQGTVVAMANGIATDEAASPIRNDISRGKHAEHQRNTRECARASSADRSDSGFSSDGRRKRLGSGNVRERPSGGRGDEPGPGHRTGILDLVIHKISLARDRHHFVGDRDPCDSLLAGKCSDETVTTMTSQKTVTTKAPAATVTPSMSATVAPAPMPPSQAVKTQETRTTVITASTDTTKIA